MVLKHNQFKDNSIDANIIEDLSIVDADISTSANIAETKIQGLPTILNTKALKAGDTLTGSLILASDPIQPNELATKNYIDTHLPNGVTTVATFPNWYISSNVLNLTPYHIINDLGQIQTNSNNSTLPFNSTYIENNSSIIPNSFYYLYATGVTFVFSLTQPNSFGTHPTQPSWIYLGSLITNNSGILIPFSKCENNYFYRQVLFSTTTSVLSRTSFSVSNLVPPTSSLALISAFFSGSGNLVANVSFYTDATNSAFSTMDFYSHNGSQAGYVYNTPRIYAPLNSGQNIYYIFNNAPGGSLSVGFLGYSE